MPRVRFLKHVMGCPGPESVYHEGQVAEVPDALIAVLDVARVGHHADSWIEEYEGEAVRCHRCGNDFALNDFVEHRQWYHGDSLPQAVAARASAQKPKGEGDIVCMDCRRPFKDELALNVHRGHVHIDDRKQKRDQPPVAREIVSKGARKEC